MTKHFFYGVAGFFVVTMIVAYSWHMLLFHDQYVAMGAFTRAAPIMMFGMSAVLLQGIVFSHVYPMYYRHKGGGHPLRRGIEFGLLFGLVVYSVMVLATAAKFQIEPVGEFILYGTAFQILQFLLVGAVIGLVYGKRPAA